MSIVVDEAWDKLSAVQLASAGVIAASLYVGQDDTGKNMNPVVVNAYAAGGVSIITNFEYGASQATGGFDQGVADAKLGLAQAAACGMPTWAPILFSVDADVSVASVTPYFQGVASVIGVKRVGVYGDYEIVKGLISAGLATFGWQTMAWSNNQVDYGQIQLLQAVYQHLDGVDVDYIEGSLANIMWRPGQANPGGSGLTYVSVPVGITPRLPELDLGMIDGFVQLMQATLNVHGGIELLTCDGDFGQGTYARVTSFQANNGLSPDGICGPDTWSKLLYSPLIAAVLSSGMSNAWVEMMQAILNVAGGAMHLTCDGVFGSETKARVEAFQGVHGLTTDGVCGLETWGALLS